MLQLSLQFCVSIVFCLIQNCCRCSQRSHSQCAWCCNLCSNGPVLQTYIEIHNRLCENIDFFTFALVLLRTYIHTHMHFPKKSSLAMANAFISIQDPHFVKEEEFMCHFVSLFEANFHTQFILMAQFIYFILSARTHWCCMWFSFTLIGIVIDQSAQNSETFFMKKLNKITIYQTNFIFSIWAAQWICLVFIEFHSPCELNQFPNSQIYFGTSEYSNCESRLFAFIFVSFPFFAPQM